MKDILIKMFGTAFGTTIASFIARIVIALLMLYTGAATDLGDAVGIVLNKDRAIASAAILIKETPKAEVKEALATENIALVPAAIEVTK